MLTLEMARLKLSISYRILVSPCFPTDWSVGFWSTVKACRHGCTYFKDPLKLFVYLFLWPSYQQSTNDAITVKVFTTMSLGTRCCTLCGEWRNPLCSGSVSNGPGHSLFPSLSGPQVKREGFEWRVWQKKQNMFSSSSSFSL